MCFEYERLESIRKEMEKLEALKKAEDKARQPAKPDVPQENTGQKEPVPA